MTSGNDVVLNIHWTMEAIREALSEERVSATDENLQKILSASNIRILEEQSIIRGWKVLQNIINDVF